jgi:hypothetical protein
MLLFLQGIFWEKIKYHIFAIDRILFDTQFCNRKSVLQDTWIIATLHGELESCFSQKLCIDQNIMKRHFCLKVNQCQVVGSEWANICTVLHIGFRFNNTFCENYAVIKIFLMYIFIPVFINEFCDGVWKCKYLYCVAILHSTLITFFLWKLCVGWNLVKGNFHLSVCHGITWRSS